MNAKQPIETGVDGEVALNAPRTAGGVEGSASLEVWISRYGVGHKLPAHSALTNRVRQGNDLVGYDMKTIHCCCTLSIILTQKSGAGANLYAGSSKHAATRNTQGCSKQYFRWFANAHT